MNLTPLVLSSAARDVLRQLFLNGPTDAGDISSKAGRGELIRHGLAQYDNGWTIITVDGLRTAIEADYDRVKERRDRDTERVPRAGVK